MMGILLVYILSLIFGINFTKHLCTFYKFRVNWSIYWRYSRNCDERPTGNIRACMHFVCEKIPFTRFYWYGYIHMEKFISSFFHPDITVGQLLWHKMQKQSVSCFVVQLTVISVFCVVDRICVTCYILLWNCKNRGLWKINVYLKELCAASCGSLTLLCINIVVICTVQRK